MAKRKASSRMPATRRTKRRRRAVAKKSNKVTNEHMFSRYCLIRDTIIVTGTGVSNFSQGYGRVFKLNDLQGVSEFLALFDQYKFVKVECFFHLQTNPDAQYKLNTSTTAPVVNVCNFYPKLWYYSDYDDGGAPLIQEVKEVQAVKCRVLEPNKMIKHVLKPKPIIQMASAGNTTGTLGYGTLKEQWIDCNNPNVEHYGLKAVVDCEDVTPNDIFITRVEFKYTIAFRGPR